MILASTTVENPTTVIIGVAMYLTGIYVTAFHLGLTDDSDSDDQFCYSLLWPVLLILIGFFTIRAYCRKVSQRKKSDAISKFLVFVKNFFVFVKKFLDFATLPLRPFSFGRKVSNWRSRKDVRNVH